MSNFRAVQKQALQLSPAERELLTHDLLESLLPVTTESSLWVDPDYEQELHRRINSLANGTATLSTGEEFLAELQQWRERAARN